MPKNRLTSLEKRRLLELTQYEREARLKGFQTIAGIDEAGRGPLAGPVVAAACIIPADFLISGVDDSKKLSPVIRNHLFQQLTSDPRILYGVGIISVSDIDELNIYQATIQAMLQALSNLAQVPDYMLVDGLLLVHPVVPCLKLIQGDQRSQSIAAASIIAKETRDALMRGYHQDWPEYGFDQHKGYGTQKHLEALNKYGPCPIHRRSFEPVRLAAASRQFQEV